MSLRRCLPTLLLAALLPSAAHAAGGVESTASTSIAEAKVAIAVAESRTTRWMTLRLRGAAAAALWIVPARPGARIDLASDAWFEALEEATAPRVLPPEEKAPCGVTPKEPEVHGDLSHPGTRPPVDTAWLQGATAVVTHAATWGIELSPEIRQRIELLEGDGHAFLALAYDSIADDDRWQAVRVIDDSRAAMPLFLTRAGSEPVTLTAFVLGPGRVSLGASPPSVIDPASVTWKRDGTSTYASLRDRLLDDGQGKSWVVESAGHDLVFAATNVPKSTKPIASLVEAYLSRAAEPADAPSCVGVISALVNRQERVGLACAAGEVTAPAEACAESSRPGEIDPATLRCGAAADLAIAFSGLRPSEVVVTRAAFRLPAGELGDDAFVSLMKGAEVTPLVDTSGYEACDEGKGGGTGQPGGGSAPPSPTRPPFPDESWEDDTEEVTSEWVACGSSSETGSTQEWDTTDSCSSGTGGSWDDDSDESCDSGGYGGSDSDEYDSCEGGSGGYESDDEECAVARRPRRAFRPRLSVYTLILAAIALPIRRRTRRIR